MFIGDVLFSSLGGTEKVRFSLFQWPLELISFSGNIMILLNERNIDSI